MQFSVAVTTYNRPVSLAVLVKQIKGCAKPPHEIIIVDSSEEFNESMKKEEGVKYIRSSHKNQPYQRYLAFLACTTEAIIFLDDDLEIIDKNVFAIMMERLAKPGIVGISVGFHHVNSISDAIEKAVNTEGFFFKFINFISGVPILKPGRLYAAGLAGPRPAQEGPVDHFNGAVMGFLWSALESSLYDPVLFALFENKLGMGEDKIISMKVSQKGLLWFIPDHFFKHPPNESNYFQSLHSFQAKVTYSRLYISRVYGQVRGRSRFFINLHFYYFSLWRLAIAAMKVLVKPSDQNKAWLRGIQHGLWLSFEKPLRSEGLSPGINWKTDAFHDARCTS